MDAIKIISLADDKAMAILDLQDDPYFSRIQTELLDRFIFENINLAKLTADKLREAYPGASATNIATLKGAKVNIVLKEFKVMKVQYRSEIYFEGKEINIVEPSIKLMYEVLKDIIDISIEELIEIHVAHELYHLLEYIEKRNTPDLLPKVNYKLLCFNKKVKILKSSEVGAHAFAKKLLNLSIHPKLLDYFYLIKINEILEEDFINYLLKIKKIYSKME